MVKILRFRGATLPYLDAEQTEAAARGTLRVFWLDEELELHLNPEERAAFEQAKVAHYVVTRDSRLHLLNVWFHWCEAIREPYVTVRLGPLWATVELDMITTGGLLTPEAVREIGEVFRRKLREGHKRGVGLWYGSCFCACDGIRREHAESVAAELYTLARKCLDMQQEVKHDAE